MRVAEDDAPVTPLAGQAALQRYPVRRREAHQASVAGEPEGHRAQSAPPAAAGREGEPRGVTSEAAGTTVRLRRWTITGTGDMPTPWRPSGGAWTDHRRPAAFLLDWPAP